MEQFLPEKPLIENADFIIYGNSDIDFIKEDLINTISLQKKELLHFFHLNSFPKTTINLFNNRENYLKFTKQFAKSTTYSKGNFNQEMINCQYDPKNLSNIVYPLVENIINEFVHLLYKKIWLGKYERKLWLEEGLAQYLDGQKSLLEKNEELFKSWYLIHIIRRDKIIPPLDFLNKQGNKYGEFYDEETKKYNGYSLSYLLVSYLIDTYPNLIDLLNDKEKIENIEKHIMNDAINYYNNLFQVKNIKNNIYDIKTPHELMDYMNLNIIYGWVDKQKNEHINTLEEFRENYISSSLEEILSHKLGTCIEQAKLIKFVLERLGFETKTFCHRNYEEDDNFDKEVRMHCFVLFKNNDCWYHFEHSNYPKRGIHKYDNIDAAIKNITSGFKENDIRELTEIPNIPEGLSFKEFNKYVNSFKSYSN